MRVRKVVSELRECVHEGPAVYGLQARTPRQVAEMLTGPLGSAAQEVFAVLLLDGKHRVTQYAEASRGTLTASLVHPREVYGVAVRMGAAAIIVAHNHPSGDPEPSAEDLAVTERLKQAGQVLGIPLLDHVILGADGAFVSLRDRGLV